LTIVIFCDFAAETNCLGGAVPLDQLNQDDCADGWYKIGTQCYHVVQYMTDPNTARQECINRGGQLAWILSKEVLCELGVMIDSVTNEARRWYWVGAIRVGPDTQFVWVDNNGQNG